MTDLRRRLLSWWWDYLVVLAWLLAVFVVIGLPTLLGWASPEAVWTRPVAADLAVTVLTVLPYLVYLVRTESGPAHATWGKRRGGLVVGAEGGPHVGAARATIRNVIKVLPWQFGHMAAMRFSVGVDLGSATILNAAALILLALVMGPPLAGRRGLHDLIAGTTVRAASPVRTG